MEKIQRAKVGVAGSFVNQLMSNNATLPEVGKGATVLHYTDRSCYEVIEVSKDGKTVKLEALDAEWDKTKQGGHGHQNWILKPTGRFMTVVWRQNAWRTIKTEIVFTEEFRKEANDHGFAAIGAYMYKHKPELHAEIYANDVWPSKLVEGVTREKKSYNAIKILFGSKDYYYDWSF